MCPSSLNGVLNPCVILVIKILLLLQVPYPLATDSFTCLSYQLHYILPFHRTPSFLRWALIAFTYTLQLRIYRGMSGVIGAHSTKFGGRGGRDPCGKPVLSNARLCSVEKSGWMRSRGCIRGWNGLKEPVEGWHYPETVHIIQGSFADAFPDFY